MSDDSEDQVGASDWALPVGCRAFSDSVLNEQGTQSTAAGPDTRAVAEMPRNNPALYMYMMFQSMAPTAGTTLPYVQI